MVTFRAVPPRSLATHIQASDVLHRQQLVIEEKPGPPSTPDDVDGKQVCQIAESFIP
jgi:hypothetical protein